MRENLITVIYYSSTEYLSIMPCGSCSAYYKQHVPTRQVSQVNRQTPGSNRLAVQQWCL